MAAVTTTVEKKKRTENREVRRRQLIEATIESIAELGFSDTTLASVTKRAGLSHGTINFHFKSKDILFAETLGYLAAEHHDLWTAAAEQAGPRACDKLAAIIDVDFEPQICSLEKLAVWFSFWGQVKYRPTYVETHDKFDLLRTAELQRLCAEIIEEGGYKDIDGVAAGRRIEAILDGAWLNMLLYPEQYPRKASRDDAFAFLALLFPKHFSKSTGSKSIGAACKGVPSRRSLAKKG